MTIFQFYIRIKTGESANAGTDDRLFLGLFGKNGGREFTIASKKNDFKKGDNVTFTYGSPLLTTSVDPPLVNSIDGEHSAKNSGDFNDPNLIPLLLEQVEYVYVRKAGSRRGNGDDRFELAEAEAKFWGASGTRKFVFAPRRPLWLGNEAGLQVWLVEER